MEKTKQYAPNHIKYAANLNVAPVSAHLGYCGIGWNGIGKNVQHIRGLCQEIQYGQTPIAVPYCSDETPEESATRVAANAVAMANPTMTGGRRRKVNRRNKTKKAKSKSRMTRSNKH